MRDPRLLLLAEANPWELEHAERVAVYAVAVAERIGLSDERLREIRIAAELHDIGKRTLYELPEPAWSLHAELGASEVGGLIGEWIRQHHERIDGCGYPRGLRGDAIAIEAQIIGLAEAFDVLLHGAPFASNRGLEEARQVLETGAFDPNLREALFAVQPLIQPVGT
jgi:HD-GYP domain-containing protein (c-di-GMP phosphodiesterase class II)